DELQIQRLSGESGAHAVSRSFVNHLLRECTRSARDEPDIQEAGAGDLNRLYARRLGQLVGDGGCEFPGNLADPLGDLHGQVGRVIAVLGIARSLDGRAGRQHTVIQATLDEYGVGGGEDGVGELLWRHRTMVSALDSGL